MKHIYLSLEQAKEIHEKTIEVSGGGTLGVLDGGRLDSVLQHIQNDDYYPIFLDKITHLFFATNKFHTFQDGNKRIAITLSAQFLLLNGYMYCSSRFIREMENISYHLAAGRIDRDLLRRVIESVINETIDTDEELKLDIFHAIKDDSHE
ncbi:MAG: type II toxin-antitoxin system death-on-curing family toxin [Spirochaetaceae bacterium]|nr:MAG: type II toxin-antitoxin system death-on-curing family toxin [Spirochaetaceae bacterium]